MKTNLFTRSLSVCFSSLLGALLAACQPSVPQSGFRPNPVIERPQIDDRLLESDSTQQSAASPADAVKSDPIAKEEIQPILPGELNIKTSGTIDEQLEDAIKLFDAAEKYKNANLKKQAQTRLRAIFTNPRFGSGKKFKDAPYYQLFLAQSQKEFLKATAEIENIFDSQKTALFNIFEVMRIKQAPLPPQISLSDALSITERFVTEFENQIQNSKTLMPEVKNGIRDGLNERFWLKLQKLNEFLKHRPAPASSGERFQSDLEVMKQFLTQFEIELSPSEAQALTQADQIAGEVTRPLTARETLTFLIELWESLPPAERESTFREASPELHEFLANKKDKERACLKSSSCKNIVLKFIRSAFILPKLKKVGLTEIQSQISLAAQAELNTAVDQSARESIKVLPERLRNEIFASLDKEKARFLSYRANYPTFLLEEMQSWYELEFGTQTVAYDPQNKSAKFFALTLQGLLRYGSSLPDAEKKKVDFAIVNLLLEHGGFNRTRSTPPASKLVSVSKAGKIQFLNLEDFLIPDGQLAYQGASRSDGLRLTVEERTLMMQAFRELYEALGNPRRWNSRLTQINAGQFFSRIDASDIREKAFPADAFQALAVANWAAFLIDLERPQGPLFFLCPDNSTALFGKKEACEKPTTLISLGDLPIKKLNQVSTIQHSRFLTEAFHFLRFAETSNQIKNPYLKPHARRFKDIAPSLKTLTVSLSNFLSHLLIKRNGETCSYLTLANRTSEGSCDDITNYATSAQSLWLAYSTLDITAYKTMALTQYYFLNQKFLESGRYQYRQKKSSRAQLLNWHALQVLEPLLGLPTEADTFTADSKSQAEKTAANLRKKAGL